MNSKKSYCSHLLKFLVVYTLFVPAVFAHEPWLLTEEQIHKLNAARAPDIFRHLGFFNLTIVCLAATVILLWIGLNFYIPEKKFSPSLKRQNLAAFVLRLGLGSTLILLSLGLIPRLGIAFFSQPTLFAPEFLIKSMTSKLYWLTYLQFILGMGILCGIFTRFLAGVVAFLLAGAILIFGTALFQYAGFYIGNSFFLLTQTSGNYAVGPQSKSIISIEKSLLVLQILTGVNFIYSAISIKLMQPNLDIGMLQIHQAFTFGIPYDYFTFLMLITEASLGVVLVLGYRLQIISLMLIFLFLFLSIDLGENIFAHNFIYGILITFIILGGQPLLTRKPNR